MGSFNRRRTFRPASSAACRVACRCLSSKYAGTVITTPSSCSSRLSRALVASARRISLETSTGVFGPSLVSKASASVAASPSNCASLRSSRDLPMKRLAERTVFRTSETANSSAAAPTVTSPLKFTTEGTSLAPEASAITSTPCSDFVATRLLVVPRSMPRPRLRSRAVLSVLLGSEI